MAINDEKELPCLVSDFISKTRVTLTRGLNSRRGHPDWRCKNWKCLLREGHNVYGDLRVVLGTRAGGLTHCIVLCEAVHEIPNKGERG
jgi:hypothetical protein